MKALVIGKGVQGQRWINNLQQLGYSVEAYGRNYKEKLQRNQYYDIIILAVPHYAFLEVTEFLRKNKIFARKVIIEKPGAKNREEYIEVIRNLYYVGYSEMFLPVHIEYGFIEPKVVEYVGILPKQNIKYVDKNLEAIILENGRIIDMNTLRDLFWHPASLYIYPHFEVSMRIIKDLDLPDTYVTYILKNHNNKVIKVGKSYKYYIRKIDGKDIIFDNPMKKQLQKNFEYLEVTRLPLSIWNNLEGILQKWK